MLSISPIPAFSDNYIWLLSDERGAAVVVDPGEAAPVTQALADRGLRLEAILVTHHHYDHVGGIDDLLASRPVPVYGPHNPAITTLTHSLGAGDSVEVLGERFEVMEVPGHTLDHIAFYRPPRDDAPPLLFCGDTLFAGGCGRLFEGNPSMMYRSLSQLAALPPETRVYCAHEYTLANLEFARAVEPDNAELEARQSRAEAQRAAGEPTVPSTVGEELATNPFMRSDTSELQNSLDRQGRLDSREGSEVLAVVRAWKDKF